MRKCYICKKEKEESEFHKDKTQCGGLSYECKKCKSERRKLSRKLNPQHYKEQQKRNIERNYEKIRASQKKHRLENREEILKKRKERREPRKREINARESERRKNHRLNNPKYVEQERKRQREYYAKNKEKMIPKHNAHKMVMYAIRLGMMKRLEECEKCKSTIRVEGHHEDYAKPLEVQWLCKVCHVARHNELDYKAKNA